MNALPLDALSRYTQQAGTAVARDLRAEAASWFDAKGSDSAATMVADHFSRLKQRKSGQGPKINDALALRYVLDTPELRQAYRQAKADPAARAVDVDGIPQIAHKLQAVKGLLKSGVTETKALLNALRGTTASGGPAIERTVHIDDPQKFKQVINLSDVHGMKQPLLKLLRAAGLVDDQERWTGDNTLLVVNGDSIDKGSASLGVLKLWMKLTPQAEAKGGRIVHTLGNHEAELLAAPAKDRKAVALRKDLRRDHVKLGEFLNKNSATGTYVRSMPLGAKVGKWFFLHAGLFPQKMGLAAFEAKADAVLSKGDYKNKFLVGRDSVLEAMNWWKNPKIRAKQQAHLAKEGIWGVSQGHQPDAYDIPDKIGAIDGGHLVKTDTGMPPEAGSHSGYLLRFPHPEEMLVDGFPTLEAIAPDGTVTAVHPDPRRPK